jgi:YD repeat-containing protein
MIKLTNLLKEIVKEAYEAEHEERMDVLSKVMQDKEKLDKKLSSWKSNPQQMYKNLDPAEKAAEKAFDKANSAVIASTNFTFGQMVVADGDDSLKSLANASYTLTGTLDAANTITSLTVDDYGRVTAATAAAIAIDAQQITAGTLGYNRGGTGSTSYTTGALLVAGVSGLESLANTTYTATGSGAANNTVSSLTVDTYGRVTAATFSAISGLTVGQGGTGRSTFTTNGIVFGNSTDGLLVTAAAGTSDQTFSNQILTVTNAGVPVWSSAMDGGTF